MSKTQESRPGKLAVGGVVAREAGSGYPHQPHAAHAWPSVHACLCPHLSMILYKESRHSGPFVSTHSLQMVMMIHNAQLRLWRSHPHVLNHGDQNTWTLRTLCFQLHANKKQRHPSPNSGFLKSQVKHSLISEVFILPPCNFPFQIS